MLCLEDVTMSFFCQLVSFLTHATLACFGGSFGPSVGLETADGDLERRRLDVETDFLKLRNPDVC